MKWFNFWPFNRTKLVKKSFLHEISSDDLREYYQNTYAARGPLSLPSEEKQRDDSSDLCSVLIETAARNFEPAWFSSSSSDSSSDWTGSGGEFSGGGASGSWSDDDK